MNKPLPNDSGAVEPTFAGEYAAGVAFVCLALTWCYMIGLGVFMTALDPELWLNFVLGDAVHHWKKLLGVAVVVGSVPLFFGLSWYALNRWIVRCKSEDLQSSPRH